MRDSSPVVGATGDVGFRTRAAHGRRGGVAQPGPVARTHGDALLSGRGRVGHIVRRLRDRGRGLGNEPRDNSLGHVTKVDEGGGASATLRALLGAGDLALGDHPVPGAVVDNLDVLVAVQLSCWSWQPWPRAQRTQTSGSRGWRGCASRQCS